MAGGLLGMGQNQLQQSMDGFGKVSSNEAQRNQSNDQLEAQYQAAEKSQQGMMAGTGAVIGLTAAGGMGAGMAALGPVGLGIAGGLLLAEIF